MECPMLPWQPARCCCFLSGRNASLQVTFFVSHYTCQLIYPHKFEVANTYQNILVHTHRVLNQEPNWIRQTQICEAELTIYL